MRLRNVSIIIGIFILLIASYRAYNQVKGDFRYQNESSLLGVTVRVKLKILLQGCYRIDDGQMSTLLNAGSHLPLTSPYCEDQRTVSAIPPDITDWVLVQLHSSVDGAPVASHSAFLRQDGYIVADDGTTNILVITPPGNYYVAVVHRNHLTIMTNSAIALNSDTAVLYDFTNNITKCYGVNGMAELEPGVWGMWAGDIYHDGVVTTRDYKIWFESYRVGLTGYQPSDVDRNGVVDNQDYLIWLSNAQKGATSSVQRVGDEPVMCLSADSLEFGAVAIDATSDKMLSISNTGGAELSVSSMSTTNAAFTIIGSTSFNIAAGAYQEVMVRFAPTSATSYNATLRINNNSAESAKDVPLKGTGIETGTVTDIDGNKYMTVKIGNQWWMAENLKVTHYSNGDVIPIVTDNGSWMSLTTGAYCEYDNNASNVATYGRLYNWYSVNDIRGIAPIGWHMPSDEEWKTLEMYLGMSRSQADAASWRGTNEGGRLKETTTEYWLSPNTGATNASGFSALPGGYRDFTNGIFYHLGTYANFWSSTESRSDYAWYRVLSYSRSDVDHSDYGKPSGLSVRCVRSEGPDNTPPSASFSIAPTSGTTQTDFQFDASGSTDVEDAISSLQVRWDWTNDGTWDTNYTTSKTATQKYNIAATYTINLEIKDSGGLTNTTTRQLIVSEAECIDIDGNTYKTIEIGTQWWMAENLKVTHYRNGDAIPNVTSATEWASLTTGAYCSQNNNEANVATYGRLYNWYTVVDSRNIAPVGFHVPSDAEWETLVNYLGGDAVAGGKMKEIGISHWRSPNTGATNESGFSGLPGGYRNNGNGGYDYWGSLAYFWCTTEYDISAVLFWALYADDSVLYRRTCARRDGFSVRCVRD